MADVVEVWADTGEVVERDYTADEKRQHTEDQKASAEAEAKQNAVIKAARDHAASLGFTDEMLAIMYPAIDPTK